MIEDLKALQQARPEIKRRVKAMIEDIKNMLEEEAKPTPGRAMEKSPRTSSDDDKMWLTFLVLSEKTQKRGQNSVELSFVEAGTKTVPLRSIDGTIIVDE
ncbi:hypothetical protein DFQ29_008817 [Apophysomyces sp. BC1021]|nr:hypothetical protein DFQ29_008817 [Apophysomyces sp. BC1021]